MLMLSYKHKRVKKYWGWFCCNACPPILSAVVISPIYTIQKERDNNKNPLHGDSGCWEKVLVVTIPTAIDYFVITLLISHDNVNLTVRDFVPDITNIVNILVGNLYLYNIGVRIQRIRINPKSEKSHG
jgi:hypothetical protein